MRVKILLVNEYSANNEDAVGITLRSFFLNRKFDIYNLYHLEKNDSSKKFFRGKKIPFYLAPFDTLLRNFSKNSTSNEMADVRDRKENVLIKVKIIIKFISEYILLFWSRKDIKKIEEFDPDYVYTIGGSVISIRLSLILSRKFSVPLVIHVMDNWMETLYQKPKIVQKVWRSLLNEWFKKADKVIVISDKMKREFSGFIPEEKMSVISNIAKDYYQYQDYKKYPTNLGYIGGLHLGRMEKLLAIMRESTNSDEVELSWLRFIVYTNSPLTNRQKETLSKFADMREPLPHEKLAVAYGNLDILLHIESDDPSTQTYTKYSFSTKITEYLFSGKPIIYFGPQDNAIAEYLKKYNLAFCINNYCEFIKLIDDMHQNFSYYLEHAVEVRNFAIKNLGEEKIRKVLNNIFYVDNRGS